MVTIKSPLPNSRLPNLSLWIFAGFLLAAFDRARVAEGQTTDAMCVGTNWTWAHNSKQHSPCLVAAYLLAPCTGGQWTVPKLPPNEHYRSPDLTMVNNCQCSTVVYSLLSACAFCQTNTQLTSPRWSSWRTNCTESMISISKYPNHINNATAVPAWAYLDVVTPDQFQISVAKQIVVLGSPESTVGNNEVSTSSSTSSSTSTSPLTDTSSQPSTTALVVLNSNSNTSTNTSNTPAIIGGSVGGVVGLGLLVALVLYLRKQDEHMRSKRQAPSAAFARARATPDVAAAAGFRSASRQANHPLASGASVGHGSSAHGHRGASPVFQLGYANGIPWSPPPPCSTPTGAASPMSADSLISTHNHAGGGRFGGNSIDYPNSSSGHGTGNVLGHSGSISSLRSTNPMMQYASTPTPPLGVPVPGPYANTRPPHPHNVGYTYARSGSYQSQFSGLPEI